MAFLRVEPGARNGQPGAPSGCLVEMVASAARSCAYSGNKLRCFASYPAVIDSLTPPLSSDATEHDAPGLAEKTQNPKSQLI